ncbi:MAG: DUF2087 domain-containing protein [Anaerolineales bacterium]|nr:DUF2087 domain-containing protein [Anaerolineales bacterium]
MDTQPEMLDFVKAVSDVERLRIIGALTRGPAHASDIADNLGMSFRDAIGHLAFLAFVNIVKARPAERKQDEVYELEPSGLEKLSHQQFAGRRESYIPAPNLDNKTRKVLATHLNADGSVRQIPHQPAKLRVILDYIVTVFTPGANYTEKEVNTILRRFHLDVASLRRALIDAGLMQRESDGSRYWRSPMPKKEQPA